VLSFTLCVRGLFRLRNVKIDFLRFIGLSLIILAHVNPPGWLFQLRNFDVSLMVIVSGLAFTQSTTIESYRLYLWKRIKRLVFPVWIFLSVYFVCIWLFDLEIEKLTLKSVLDSYMLINGIGYVWIIRVFLLVALVAPMVAMLNERVKDNRVYLLIIASSYSAYELFLYLTLPYTGSFIGELFSMFVYYGISFSLVFALGVRIPRLTGNLCLMVAVISFLVFALLGFSYYNLEGRVVTTQEYKYPPSAYYIFYAILVSVLAWLMVGKIECSLNKFKRLERVILFVAQNSIWVYLWHIPLVKLFKVYSDPNFIFKYVVIYFGAALITFVQVSIVKKVLLPVIAQEATKKNVKILLTG
jgi:peptidoglycan/LPS O-acetylase OafA/YrhL